MEQVASTLPPPNDLESALYGRINPGTYTVIVRGKNDATGVGVFEVYDLEPTADSKLANVSTRGLVQTGDNVLIGGVIVRGQDPLRVIVRAIGPSLSVPGALADPTLELRDGNGALIVATLSQLAIPQLTQSIISDIVNGFVARKVLALDLDNTLWGGVIGEDGLDGVILGHDFPGNVYLRIQREYLTWTGGIAFLAQKREGSALR